MRLLQYITVVTGVIAAMLAGAGTAGADPSPTPAPPYQIAGPSGPVLPGVEQYPPICLQAPLACALRYDPGTGTWQPGTRSPYSE
jgi:hypothetical protein